MVLAETLTLLALHQDQQELAYQELLSELGDQDEPVSTKSVWPVHVS
jgi:hypothetical protein